MCYSTRERAPEPHFLRCNYGKRRCRSRVRVHRFMRRRKWELERIEKEIEEKNLKLYLENKCILEENIQLRKKALLLRQENLALLSQLQQKFSQDRFADPSFESKS